MEQDPMTEKSSFPY